MFSLDLETKLEHYKINLEINNGVEFINIMTYKTVHTTPGTEHPEEFYTLDNVAQLM